MKTDQFNNQKKKKKREREREREREILTNNQKTRNSPQLKGKEESSEGVINEIEASQLSDTEFKIMVIRKLNELTENYQNYTET